MIAPLCGRTSAAAAAPSEDFNNGLSVVGKFIPASAQRARDRRSQIYTQAALPPRPLFLSSPQIPLYKVCNNWIQNKDIEAVSIFSLAFSFC